MKRIQLFIVGLLFSAMAFSQNDSIILVTAKWDTTVIYNGILLRQAALNNYFSSNQYITCVEVSPKSPVKLAFSYAEDLEYTSKMAKESNAIVAFNGSFFDMKYHNPICFLRIDGKDIGENTNKNTPYRKYYQYGTLALDNDNKPIIMHTDSLRIWEKGLPYSNIMTAGPLLILNGEEQPMRNDRTFVTYNHNRTAIGIKEDGTILLITVDGRHKKAKGMSLTQLIKTLKWLGCKNALNLDGGGSTTCYIKDMGVINYPSDNNVFDHKGERKVSNAILLIPTENKRQLLKIPHSD